MNKPAFYAHIRTLRTWALLLGWLLTWVMLAGLFNGAVPQTAQAQDADPGGGTPASLDAVLVVKVFFSGEEELRTLAARLDVWEVRRDEGYIIAGMQPQEFNLLSAQGYRLELDEAQTELLNRPLEYLPQQVSGIPGFPCYRTVVETFSGAQGLANTYPTLAEWLDIGNSWEKNSGLGGWDIWVLRLTNEAIGGDKPKLMIVTGLHAREYTPPELAMRFAEYLLNNYGVDPDVTWMLDSHEVHLVLHANPDGRIKAETGLLWRKNTNNNFCANTDSRGVDLNRNFSFQWGCCGGSSGTPCNYEYRGPSPASEPETQAIQNYVRSLFPDERPEDLFTPAPADKPGIFLDIHSYGKLILWPWGFTPGLPPNNAALVNLGYRFAFFNGYIPVQAIQLYPTDGATDDFAYGDVGVAAYTFELGTNFFELCSYFEGTIMPQNRPALLYALRAARTPYQAPFGPDTLSITLPAGRFVQAGQPLSLAATANDTRYATAARPPVGVTGAEAYTGVPPWNGGTPTALSAQDGAFGGSIENIQGSASTAGLSSGKHLVYLRSRDESYWGPPYAAFFYIYDQYTLQKTVNKTAVLLGDELEYTLTFTLQMGGSHTGSFSFSDPLPPETSLVPGSVLLNGSPAPELFNSDQNVIEEALPLTFSGSTQVVIQYKVLVAQALPDAVITTQAQANVVLNTYTMPTLSAQTNTPFLADLAFEKHVSDPEPSAGQVFTYTLSVLNQGGFTAESVEVVDDLPAGLALVSAPECMVDAGVLRCPLGTLLPGQSALREAVVTGSAGWYTNTATVVSTLVEPDEANNTASVAVHVVDDEDGDGILDHIENGAPNNGDANQDGIPDAQQPNVASLPAANGTYLTLETASPAAFNHVAAAGGLWFAANSALLTPYGMLQFALLPELALEREVTPTLQVTLTVHCQGCAFAAYWSLLDDQGEWGALPYDGGVGALLADNQALLFLQDGAPGDWDGAANGQVQHTGALVIQAYRIWMPIIGR